MDLEDLKNLGKPLGQDYQVQKVGNILQVIPENDFEAKEMNVDEIAKAIENKAHAMSKKHPTKINSPKTTVNRSKDTLKSVLEPYYEDLKYKQQVKNKNSKAYMKYKQALDYLYEFFGEKTLVKNISEEDAEKFQLFLTKVPKDYKNKKDLKGKSIKLLIDKKSSLLDKYDKQEGRTVDEVIVKCKKYFDYLTKKKYIPESPFESEEIENLGNKKATSRREFKINELQEVFKVLKTEDIEYTKLTIFLLYCGFRRGEALELTVDDVDLSKPYIDTDGNKTINAKRVVPLHKDIIDMIESQIAGKYGDDYLFFNDRSHLKTRIENLGTELNTYILKAVGSEKKKHLDLHSLRKNYAQEVFFARVLSDTNLKTLIGHSRDSNDVTDNNYLLGKRDFDLLKESIDKVDFSKYIPEDIYKNINTIEDEEDTDLEF